MLALNAIQDVRGVRVIVARAGGVTSSGKSTVAEALARRCGLHFIELDALHWEPIWHEAPLEVFRKRVEQEILAEQWAVAGNYHVVRDLIWVKAEAVIWLDYPLLTVLRQLTRRTLRRWWNQELLWGTNRERLSTHFKLWSQDSLFHWLFKTYWRRKREILTLLSQQEHQHLKLLRFTNPSATQRWLEGL